MARGKEPLNSIIDATLELAAEGPWPEVTLEAIADRSGVLVDEVRALTPNPAAVLKAFMARTDAAMLDAFEADTTELPRERLLHVVLHRLNMLDGHKPALRNINAALERDIAGCLALAMPRLRSCEAMLTACQIDDAGLRGAVRAKGLALVYHSTMRTWLNDDDPAIAVTEAALERQLRIGEDLLRASELPVGIATIIAGVARNVCERRREAARQTPPEDGGPLSTA